MIAEDYFQAYVDLLSDLGGELDAATGLVRLPSNKVPSVPDMKFGLDAGTLSLVGDAQFFPESLNPSLGIAGKDAEGFRYSVTSTLGLTMSLDSWMASLERFTTGYNSKTGTINFGMWRCFHLHRVSATGRAERQFGFDFCRSDSLHFCDVQ